MKKQIEHFPSQFLRIAARTKRLGSWEITMPTAANVNSFKTSWYHFVAALKDDNRIEEWLLAVKVKVTTHGLVVRLEDRDRTPLAKMLDDVMENEPVDEAKASFEQLMKERK